MTTPTQLTCLQEGLFVFELDNPGYWYGRPMAVNVVVYCNFAPQFELREILYGSTQETTSTR